MSYTRPPANAADITWVGATPYTRPGAAAADLTWQDSTPPPAGTPARAHLALPWQPLARVSAQWSVRSADLIPVVGRVDFASGAIAGTVSTRVLLASGANLERVAGRIFVASGADLEQVAARLQAVASMTGAVSGRILAPALLRTTDPVATRQVLLWSAPSATITVLSPAPAMRHARAGLISPLSVRLSTDTGSAVWTADIALADAAGYSRISIGDAILIEIADTIWALICDQKNRTRPDGYTLQALSPVAMYSEPWTVAVTLGTAGMAQAACERLLEQDIDWALPDWRLPDSAAALSATPLALAQQIVAAVGGTLESLPDGSLRARPINPISPPTRLSVVVATLTDDHLIAHSESVGMTALANHYIITSGTSASIAATVQTEVIDDPDDPTHRTVRAYPYPWRALTMAHTGDSLVRIGSASQTSQTCTETLEIVAGSATAQHPIQSVISAVYRYVNLGAVSHAGADITTASAEYSLLDITYRAPAWQWEVYDPRIESIQFLVME